MTSAFLAGLSLAATPQPQPHHAASPGDSTPRIAALRATGALTGVVGLAGLTTTAVFQARELDRAARCSELEATKVSSGSTCFGAPPIGDRAMRVGGLSLLVGSGFAAGYLLGRARGLREAELGRSYRSNRDPLLLVTALMVTTTGTLLLASNLGGFAAEHACDTDACRLQARTTRYWTTDLAAAGLAFGVGLGAHTLGRAVEYRRDRQLSLAPGASRNGASLALSGRF